MGPLLRIPLRASVEVDQDNIEKTRQLAADGYGFLILGTHFSWREGFDFIVQTQRYLPISDKPIVMPISLHQYERQKGLLDHFSAIAGITISPVGNEDAVKYGYELGAGLPEYARNTREALLAGGAAGIAIQTGRRNELELGQVKKQPLRFMLSATRTKPSSSVALLFLPMTPFEENVDYKAIYEKKNLFKKYDVRFGPIFTIAEMYQLLKGINTSLRSHPIALENADRPTITEITIDELALVILSIAVDPKYNHVPKELGQEFLIEYFFNPENRYQ
ncbi:hypothetical protein A2866_01180 [Candidatus Roizmanbacteria bacterium RIFCSPHIGHO2_01_FULL_39_8]|uniref:Luciferase-like domain-containing protein n=3 Tax=Candidatus Roizmaniibacteriota TaxID=1752723 RepID=A0A1F7GR60_9BACT|nr:MAG: hypothetical protein A2866_01180 [Candidatus Roizmanbacteria bacterium RIFCSPHIGHO2_01_FULL_39_8]OGK28228.1 MAG: hypothetical protein A3C28_05170 [Candidatus Roizmanbacteria bacterium RIFCSPHIGHO2_02_FULL_39_9]OGK35910.1 MAG: hypothetical protein A3F60_03480 [Candidatus Roizmanbacteria bacterium RIFCSPHIGHO2_12_FULL_39_8]